MTPGFAWSYSALKNFETCPKRYWHYNVNKDVKEPETAELRDGHALHGAFENRIKRSQELPPLLRKFEPFLAHFIAQGGTMVAEQKLALDATFQPVPFFGGARVWFRTVVDAMSSHQDWAVILDWKTGKPREDLTQLQLMALTVFAHNPSINVIKSALVFVHYDHMEPAWFRREQMTEIWGEILPRVKALQKARDGQEFPPAPSGLCRRYCAVTSCPYHGK